MRIDFSGCKSAIEQEVLLKLSKIHEGVFVELYGNFHSAAPYVLALHTTGVWHTFTISKQTNGLVCFFNR